ncbi:MAG TPA: histidine phosphatase family protein [Burkholderiales bacterium]|nr:histidine phosphatase family protein [Burkholderiales bacterium]
MAAVFLLIRHASHELLGKTLAGRMPGVVLSAAGEREADALASRLARCDLSAVYTSPRERARQTAAPLAARADVTVRVEDGLDEIDFGDWTGRSFASLQAEPVWATWNEKRSEARPPGGETIVAVQRRVNAAIDRLRRVHDGHTVALVTHGDVIKAALAHVLRISLDDLERFAVAPASVSVIAIADGWAQVRLVNGSSYRLAD